MIETTRAGAGAVVRMAHGKANAMDTKFLRALHQALEDAARSDASYVIVTGTGTIFSAGVDLFQVLEGGRPYLEEFLPALSDCFRHLFGLPKPVIAAVNGHAIAGGCIVTCACDYRLMAAGNGKIGIPELRVGVPFPLSAIEIMRYALPMPTSQQAALFGGTYSADEALTRGFIDETIAPERLMTRAHEVGAALSSVPHASFASAKTDLRRPVFETWARHAETHDRETLREWASDEVREAIERYVSKTLKR